METWLGTGDVGTRVLPAPALASHRDPRLRMVPGSPAIPATTLAVTPWLPVGGGSVSPASGGAAAAEGGWGDESAHLLPATPLAHAADDASALPAVKPPPRTLDLAAVDNADWGSVRPQLRPQLAACSVSEDDAQVGLCIIVWHPCASPAPKQHLAETMPLTHPPSQEFQWHLAGLPPEHKLDHWQALRDSWEAGRPDLVAAWVRCAQEKE